MIVLPQLAYIGHAFLNYTIHNSLSPNVTPRGAGFYDTFTNGTLSFVATPPTIPPSISAIADFEANLDAAPFHVDMIPGGGDYFKALPSGYLELDTHAAGIVRESGAVVRFTAGGFIKINDKVATLLAGKATKSLEFGDTEFWEPITVDTGDKGLAWLNEKMVLSQGRLLVENGRGYGMELRLFMMVNGVAPEDEAPAVEDVTEEVPKVINLVPVPPPTVLREKRSRVRRSARLSQE